MFSIDTMQHSCKEKRYCICQQNHLCVLLITFYMEMSDYAYDLALILNLKEMLKMLYY